MKIIENETLTFKEFVERLENFADGIIVNDLHVKNCTITDCPEVIIETYGKEHHWWFDLKMFLFQKTGNITMLAAVIDKKYLLNGCRFSFCKFNSKYETS